MTFTTTPSAASSASTRRVPVSSQPVAMSRKAGLMRALAAPLLIAVMLQNIGNLALHAVLGRSLTPDEYGALGAVLALMVFLTVPLGALQVAASKTAAYGPSSPAQHRRSFLLLLAAGVGASLIVMAVAGPLTQAFHLSSTVDALLLGPFIGISILLAVIRGRLLGLDPKKGVTATAITFVISIVARILLTLLLLPSLGATGAILATLIGETFALAYGLYAMRRMTKLSYAFSDRPWLHLPDIGWSGVAIGGLFLFTTIDLFLARYYLQGDLSGGYVAAATIGKTLLALPAAALAAAYPRMVKAGRSADRLPELRRTGIVVAGLALFAATVVAVFPNLILTALYGDTFAGNENIVRMLAIIAGVSSLISISTYSLLAINSRMSFLPWAGAGLQFIAITIWHDSMMEIAIASATALFVTLIICIAAVVKSFSNRAPAVNIP